MHSVKFGLFLTSEDIESAQQSAIYAEGKGFYSVSFSDHLYSPIGELQSPQFECFTALSVLASVTKKIKLVPTVAAASFRTPALLAKITSTLDVASNGRFICGLGAGWFSAEYKNHGYSFPSLSDRLEQLEECVQVLKAMWIQEEPSFQGKHFSIQQAYNYPRPVQKPHPPLMIGGSGTGVLRIAAAHADILSIIPPTSKGKSFTNDATVMTTFDIPRMKQRIAVLHNFMSDMGRDPGAVELSGIVLTGVSDKPNDSAFYEVAASFGFTDYDMARRSPMFLLGTPEEVTQELQSRIEETGMTYFMIMPMSDASLQSFVENVMPAF